MVAEDHRCSLPRSYKYGLQRASPAGGNQGRLFIIHALWRAVFWSRGEVAGAGGSETVAQRFCWTNVEGMHARNKWLPAFASNRSHMVRIRSDKESG